jgi:probable phosphoglycerate mutase
VTSLPFSALALNQPRFPKNGAYFIRHGETPHTNEKKVTGAGSNPPLAPEGKSSMEAAGKLLSKSGVDCIYCNHLERNKQSAEILSQNLGGAEIRVKAEMMPQHMGEFGGKTIAEVGQQLKQYSRQPGKPVPGGESTEAAFTRFRDYMKSELEESKKEPAAYIVHGKQLAALPAVLASVRGEKPDLSKVPVTSEYGPGSVIWVSPDAKQIKVLKAVAPEKTVS